MGSVTSQFQFLSYKIDKIEFRTINNTGILLKTCFEDSEWVYSVAMRHPLRIRSKRLYLGGLDITVRLGNEKNPDVFLDAGVMGAFRVLGDDFPKEFEEKFAKIQIPALLSPYLRAAITSTFSSAGFGSIVLPLLNFNALAEAQMKDVEIQEIEEEGANASDGDIDNPADA